MNVAEESAICDYTVAEVRHDGMFPVVFGLLRGTDDPNGASDEFAEAYFYGVHGAGFVCLDKESAERWAAQIDEQHANRSFRAVPIMEAQEQYSRYLATFL